MMQTPPAMFGAVSGAGNDPNRDTNRGQIDSDFETFLQMLTTQMQNQDPLNPMESTDFAVQLATFSGVEQQVRTNQLLEALTAEQGMSDLAGWVGMDARASVPGHYEDSPIRIAAPATDPAYGMELVVRDSSGNEVDRSAVPGDARTLTWPDGGGEWDYDELHDDGAPGIPPGEYHFAFEVFDGDTMIDTFNAEIYSRVVEARHTPEGTMLVFEGGSHVPADEIVAIRAPG